MAEHSSPYRGMHSDLSSSFFAPQPIDTRIESIRDNVRNHIPATLDTVLFVHGTYNTELASEGGKGAIPLYPALAQGRMKVNPEAERDYQRQEALLAALTEHRYFPLSHVRIHVTNGAMSEFSLVFTNPQSQDNESYELHGALGHPEGHATAAEDEFYLIETARKSGLQPALPLDNEIATAIINTACIQQGCEEVPDSLTDKLTYLLDQSASKTVRKSGEYLAESGETLLQADRSELITRRLGRDSIRVMAYGVRIQRSKPGPTEAVGVTSALSLNHDVTNRPRYSAAYDMLVNDPHRTMEEEARTALFEERFMLYRAKPELFFDEIADTLSRAAELS